MKRAVIYNRTSTLEQNPELQLKDCEDYCKENNFEIVNTFSEKVSAYKNEAKRLEFIKMLEFSKQNNIDYIVVWNMDRFSRQPPDEVLSLIKTLKIVHNIKVSAVKGDKWSSLINSVSNLDKDDFLGKAMYEFLETVIQGIEFQRSHQESKVKSERVKLAMVRQEGKKTKSYKGNNWGRKSFGSIQIQKVLDYKTENPNASVREVADNVVYFDKNNNERKISKSSVHKILQEFGELKS